MVVELRIRGRPLGVFGQELPGDLGELRRITHVEQRGVHVGVPTAGLALLTDAQQQTLTHGLQVVGEARNDQFAQQGGGSRITDIDGEQRIGLQEGDQVCGVPDEPGRIQMLARRQTGEAPYNVEGVAGGVEHVDTVVVSGAPGAVDQFRGVGVRRDIEVAVVFFHRELIEQGAGDHTTGLPCDLRAGNDEPVDTGVVGRPGIGVLVLLGAHVQCALGHVDGVVPGGHHGAHAVGESRAGRSG